MKKLIATLAILLLTTPAFGQFWKEKIETQVLSFAEITAGNNSADLGEVDCGDAALILWFVVETASTNYDIHFFTQDNASWAAGDSSGVDTDEMVYQVEGITTGYYKDDILFPFTSTGNSGKMYVGIHNTTTDATFNVRVFWSPRNGIQHAEW